MSKYPQNYDFGKNWKTKIVPFLDHASVKIAIKKGINAYLSDYPYSKKYESNTVPASYTTSSAYIDIMERKEEILYKEHHQNGKLPTIILVLEEYNKTANEDDYTFCIVKDIYLRRFFTWDLVKYDIESYVLYHSCFTWAPTFELTLAKLVCPNETWKIRKGKNHCTVINIDQTKIFDLLYWTCDGRLENYLFSDDCKKDKTLGGKQAWLDSK